jgi:site-specific DNA recombinase
MDQRREKLDVALNGLREQAKAEAARQRRRLAKLNEEREKLLHAYYAGAVPVDLLRTEQDRLASEARHAERHLKAAEASLGDIADTLDKALDLLADCQRAYVAAPGHLRRQWTRHSSSGSSFTTATSRRPILLSRSQRWPIPSFPLG